MSRGQFFVSRNTGYWRFRHPPRDGTRSHDFQTLQFDFGLLLDPRSSKMSLAPGSLGREGLLPVSRRSLGLCHLFRC
jgi:hypothetical protein